MEIVCKALVTVVIAAFNAQEQIERAINSVQAQTYDNWEIIVVDDNSGDGTCAVVEQLSRDDRRIRLVKCRKNAGPSVARNHGIEKASGEWIAVLDADDAWLPRRLEYLLLDVPHDDADLIADNYIQLDEESGDQIGNAFRLRVPLLTLTASRVLAAEHPFSRMRYGLLKPIIRKQSLIESGIVYNQKIRYGEDILLLVELLMSGRRGVLAREPMYIYTLPRGIDSDRKSKGSRAIAKLDQRILIADILTDKYHDLLDAGDLKYLKKYKRWAAKVYLGQRIVQGAKSMRIWPILSLIVSPLAVTYYLATAPYVKRLRAITLREIYGSDFLPTVD